MIDAYAIGLIVIGVVGLVLGWLMGYSVGYDDGERDGESKARLERESEEAL